MQNSVRTQAGIPVFFVGFTRVLNLLQLAKDALESGAVDSASSVPNNNLDNDLRGVSQALRLEELSGLNAYLAFIGKFNYEV